MSTLQTTILKHPDSTSNNLKLDSNGNVSIGNPTPVNSAGFNTLTIGNGTGTGGQIHIENSSGGNFQLWHTPTEVNYFSSLDQVFYTGGTESMRLDSGGQLNLNTTTNASLLSIFPQGTPTEAGKWADCAIGIGNSTILGHHSQMGLGYFNVGTYAPSYFGFVSTSQAAFGKGDLVFGTRNVTTDSQATQRVRITSAGQVLVGQSNVRTGFFNVNSITPALQVETVSQVDDGRMISLVSNAGASSGYSPTFLFGKTRSTTAGGVTGVANDDELGAISFQGADGAQLVEAARISSHVDGATGTDDIPGRLVFSTTKDGESAPTERLRITHSGTLQMGDPSVSANGRWVAFISDPGTANQRGRMVLYAKTGATAGQEIIQIFNGSTEKLRMRADGNVQNANDSYGSLSDEKLKENIVDAGSQWDDFKAVRFRKYNFKEETGHETFTQLGVIAQELELTSPGLVYDDADKDEDGNDLGTTTKSVKSSILTKKGLVALQEAMKRIETLEAKVAALEAG